VPVLYATVMGVAGAFALAAFLLREADWTVARLLWWLTVPFALAIGVLAYVLATDPAVFRAFFGGL